MEKSSIPSGSEPTTPSEIEERLKKIKGVGPVIAESIVDHFKLDTLIIIKSSDGLKRLQEVKGVGPEKAKVIKSSVDEDEKPSVVLEEEVCVKEKQLNKEQSTDLEEFTNDQIKDIVFLDREFREFQPDLLGKQLSVTVRGFKKSKEGISDSECEDAAVISPKNFPRLAVADGATESLFSDLWAKLIAKEYVSKGHQAIEASGIKLIYEDFMSEANERIKKMPETRHWLMYEKLSRGTHTTFAGIEFLDSSTANFVTIGDSCIFWRKNSKGEIKMQPKLEPNDFGSSPQSICHIPDTWKKLDAKFFIEKIELENSFQIILCTDALACWLAKVLKEDITNWDKIFNLHSFKDFSDLVDGLRERKEIRNDDVTLVTVNALPINV